MKKCFKQMLDKTKSTFTAKNLSKRLPILQWSKSYTSKDGIGDLLTGISVGLTLIPQSISFATLAGLPPQVYIFFYSVTFFMFLMESNPLGKNF